VLTTSTEGKSCLLVPFPQTTKFQVTANRGTLAQHQGVIAGPSQGERGLLGLNLATLYRVC